MENKQPRKYNRSIEAQDVGKRIDAWIAGEFPEFSRTYIQRLIKGEQIRVNGQFIRPNYRLAKMDFLEIEIPPPIKLTLRPEQIPIEVVYEDAGVLVLNKPVGMVVHPAHGNLTGTLVNALLAHCPDLAGIGGVNRPGIVHRLDKDTSGLLMVAKNDLAHKDLSLQIKEREVVRRYLVLVHGRVKEGKGYVDAPIGRHPRERKKMAVVSRNSKPALTHYQVREFFNAYTLLEARLETGRTHQIRVHFAYLGHPVVGDPVYGPKRPHLGLEGQALHAGVLGFRHPTFKAYLEFSQPPPAYFIKTVEKLRRL